MIQHSIHDLVTNYKKAHQLAKKFRRPSIILRDVIWAVGWGRVGCRAGPRNNLRIMDQFWAPVTLLSSAGCEKRW